MCRDGAAEASYRRHANYIKQDEIGADYRTIAQALPGKKMSGSNIRFLFMGIMKKFAYAVHDYAGMEDQDLELVARNPDFQMSIAPLLHMAYSEVQK